MGVCEVARCSRKAVSVTVGETSVPRLPPMTRLASAVGGSVQVQVQVEVEVEVDARVA